MAGGALALLACAQGSLARSHVGARALRMCAPPPAPAAPKSVIGSVVEAGFPVGKKIMFGLFTQDVDPAGVPSEEERGRLREQAASELAVISAEERQRRTMVGYVGGAATAALAASLLVACAPPTARAALIVPIWLFMGYVDSGKTGL